MTDLNDTPIDTLELSVRSTNCLKSYGIQTVGQMIAFFTENRRDQALKKIKQFGVKSYYEVMNVMDQWRPPTPEPPRSSLWDKLEPEARKVDFDNIGQAFLFSIAVSAKRIADKVCGDE